MNYHRGVMVGLAVNCLLLSLTGGLDSWDKTASRGLHPETPSRATLSPTDELPAPDAEGAADDSIATPSFNNRTPCSLVLDDVALAAAMVDYKVGIRPRGDMTVSRAGPCASDVPHLMSGDATVVSLNAADPILVSGPHSFPRTVREP